MSQGEKYELSVATFKYWIVDHAAGWIDLHLQDGRVLRDSLSPMNPAVDGQLARTIFDWERWFLHSVTTRNDSIITEGFNPHSAPPFHGRPSVYLDQNKWRVVADAYCDPRRLSDREELKAAQRLIVLAIDGGIVLPLSTGHMVETAGLYGDMRYEIGLAMAALSRGWQISHPLDVFRHEAERAMREQLSLDGDSPSPPPISTAPGAMFDSDDELSLGAGASDYDNFFAMLTMPNVVLALLIDPRKMDKDSGAKWVDHHARITAKMHALNLPTDQRRKVALRRFFNENINYYVSAYRKLSGSADFCSLSDKQLRRLLSRSPMVGLLSELFVRRFIVHSTKWHRNDLIDMFHLSNAAAHATYVAAENRTAAQLSEAQRSLGRAPNVFRSLTDLVEALNRDGVKTVSEAARAT